MATYSAADVIGKDLFAKVNINVRSNSTTNSTKLQTIKSGARVGRVYSYVKGYDEKGVADGSLWWMLEEKFNGVTGFVKHQQGWYDVKSLKEQGLQTQDEKDAEKAAEDMPWYEKLANELKKDVGKVLLIGAGVYIVVQLGTHAIDTRASRSTKTQPTQ